MAKKLSRKQTYAKLERDIGTAVPVCVWGKRAGCTSYSLNVGPVLSGFGWRFINYCESNVVGYDAYYGADFDLDSISINKKGLYEIAKGYSDSPREYHFLMDINKVQIKLWKRREKDLDKID